MKKSLPGLKNIFVEFETIDNICSSCSWILQVVIQREVGWNFEGHGTNLGQISGLEICEKAAKS